MQCNDIAEFNVMSLGEEKVPLKTVVSHALQGDTEIIRIEQARPYGDDVDVVILTKQDYMNILNQLKGH